MGRKRKDGDPLGMAGTRLAVRRGRIFYRHRASEEKAEWWEDVGTDLAEAKRLAKLYNNPGDEFGTTAYWLDMFIVDCRARVAAKTMSQRTVDDYVGALTHLKAFFGKMYPERIGPNHVSAYLDLHAKAGRPVPANRERACLSSMISWLMRSPHRPPSLMVNPCMRKSGVTRNAESKRERYVDDLEYQAVYQVASKSVQIMMELTFRTLQRPESDIVGWNTNIVKTRGDKKSLHFRQGKTGRLMDIALEGSLLELLESIVGTDDKVKRIHQPLVATLDGHHYTYDGISAMLKKAIGKVRAQHRKTGGPLSDMPSFGFRDLKGKGATDMWLAGVPIEQIQALCGHADKATTEIYVKARYRETIKPNLIAI